jgi:hypothetical protein
VGEEQQHSAVAPPVRFAGQPVPIGRSPWSQPPKKVVQRSLAPGVYQPRSAVDAIDSVTPGPIAPREPLARDFGRLRQITVANPMSGSGASAIVSRLFTAFRHVRADVAAWDCSGLSDAEFGRERDRLGRSYKVLIVDAEADTTAALDATDQLVVAVDLRIESIRGAEAMLSDLEGSDQARLGREAVVVVGAAEPDQSPATTSNFAAATAERFAGRTRAVFFATDDWDRIAQAVADGL